MRDRLTLLVPALCWMGAIYLFSGDGGSAEHSREWIRRVLSVLAPGLGARLSEADLSQLDFVLRKLGHISEYGLLALLWRRGLSRVTHRNWWALAICIAYACSDEWHQSFVPTRGATYKDVLYDAFGASAALLVAERIVRRLRQG